MTSIEEYKDSVSTTKQVGTIDYTTVQGGGIFTFSADHTLYGKDINYGGPVGSSICQTYRDGALADVRNKEVFFFVGPFNELPAYNITGRIRWKLKKAYYLLIWLLIV